MAKETRQVAAGNGNKTGTAGQNNATGRKDKSAGNNAGTRQRIELRETEFTPAQGQISVLIPAKSEVVERYMTSAGTRTSSSMVRMGTLIKITVNNNDDESRGKIMSWLDDVITGIRKDIAAVAAMIEENVKMAELDGIDLPELITVEPEKKWYTYANHPALLKLLQELSKVDAQALMVDRLWYAGLVDDKQKAISSKQLVHPFYSVVDLITKVTDIGGRKGGRYNPMDFIEALRKEESIAAMIDKYIRAKSVEANKAKSEGLDAGYHAETPEIAAE